MTKKRSRTETEIPLYLIPQAVTEKVWEWGDVLYRISVKRTHWHHYNVTARTKPPRRELSTRRITAGSPAPEKSGTPLPQAKSRRRKCPV
nr:hypothetical protein [uncultured Methanoregula sp.]